MASTQNVVEAVAGVPMARIAGVTALVLGTALVPAVARIGGNPSHCRQWLKKRSRRPEVDIITDVLERNDLLFAFVVVGAMMLVSGSLSKTMTRGRLQGSAIAIGLGLVLAYIGGMQTGGEKGLADIAIFSGLGLMGGAKLRDFAIVATAHGVDLPVM